jgi:2',3'-cyclic-nucleotide 2'-phosphodiesterase (5'-nucleotidase family)
MGRLYVYMPTLTILHTNDIHGKLDQMPRLATLINRERAQARAAGHAVLVVDAGDSTERKEWESEVTQGRANYVLLDAMGCQAAALGNNEGRWGPEVLTKLIAAVHFPTLAANLRRMDSDDLPAGLKTHTLFQFDDLTVAVAGVTAEDKPKLFQRLACRPLPAVEVLPALVPRLRAEGAHLVILLSHLGLGWPAWPGDPMYDLQVAAAVPGIDVIVGGHSHVLLEGPKRVGETLIVQAGVYGSHLGRLDLIFDPTAGRIADTRYTAIPCDESVPPDPTVAGLLELVRFEAEALQKKLNREGPSFR